MMLDKTYINNMAAGINANRRERLIFSTRLLTLDVLHRLTIELNLLVYYLNYLL